MWRPWIAEDAAARHVVLLGRGCPFDCAYCVNHAYRDLAEGAYVRYRSPAHIIEEIRLLKAAEPERNSIYLQCETIALNRNWALDLCRQLSEFNATLAKPIEYACNFRITPQCMNAEFFAALRSATIRTLEIGLESGSEQLRREVLNRKYSNAEFLRTVELARAAGMRIHIYNMIGIPDETPADYLETVRLNHAANPENTINSIFFPYPGTRLHAYCHARGYLRDMATDLAADLERRRAFLDMPQFPRDAVQRAFDWFEFRVYRGLRSPVYRWRKVFRNKVRSHFITNYLFVRVMPAWHLARRLAGLNDLPPMTGAESKRILVGV